MREKLSVGREMQNSMLTGIADHMGAIGQNFVPVRSTCFGPDFLLSVQSKPSDGFAPRNIAPPGMVEVDSFAIAGNSQHFFGVSFTGIGDEKALKILAEINQTFGIPTVTDIHESKEAELAAAYVDVLQIPAFLCRQTELLEAAAKTGKAVNIKKGQFLSGASMGFAIEKIKSVNPDVQGKLTDRGNSFGYSD